MRPINFTPAAAFELVEAFDWYERELTDLGDRFQEHVDGIIERMVVNPGHFQVVHKEIRHAVLRKFPYVLFFVIEPDQSITVIACFHGSRNPMHWLGRQ